MPALALRLALLAGSLVGATSPPGDERDLSAVAARLADYVAARTTSDGLEAADAALRQEVEAHGREHGEPLLRSPAALGRAFWLSQGYARQKLRKGKVTEETYTGGSFGAGGLEYAYRVPKSYDPEERAFPLVLTIPDADEETAQHLREHWAVRELLDEAILVSPGMPADTQEWDQVMVAGRPGGLAHVLTVLRIATERFAVDFDRVFVVGRGASVPAALATGDHAPQRFAGIVGRAGDAAELTPDNFANLPTLFTSAGPNAAAFQQAVHFAGYDNCKVEAEDVEAVVWRWMKEHPRVPYPASVTLVPGKPFPTRAYWLRVAPSSPDARASASIDAEANTIRVSTGGVSQFTLYLNDELVDLDRPIRVVRNGVEERARIERRLVTALDAWHDGTSDPGAVYVAEAVFDTSEGEVADVGEETGEDAELDARLRQAGVAAEELWVLHGWCLENGREARAPAVLRRLLRADPDHARARAALGFHGSPGAWFASAEALARHERSQEPATAEARGLVEHRSTWIHRDERSSANKGWTKDFPTGQWLSPSDEKRLAEGWVRQDLEWIPPGEAERADAGLFEVEGEWLDLRAANRRHANIEKPWRIPRPEVVVRSTADRDVALRAAEHMGRATEDLARVFGGVPALPLDVLVLRDEEQYDRFAFGDPDGRRPATDPGRTYIVHSAFFAESWFPHVDGKRRFHGMGVCYWDPLAPNGDLYGVHAARLAVGLSFVEALDPSPKAVRKAEIHGPGPDFHEAYQAEKRMPAWLRYGGAVYAERYFRDDTVGADGDPWWARAWSLANLEQRGGLRPLEQVLAFPLDPSDRDDGLKLFLEVGLVVAFLVDGECPPVVEAHADFKRVVASGRLAASHVAALTDALLDNEAPLRSFAGL